MIRVAIALESTWLGGVNYYRNLLQAVVALPDRRIEPLLALGERPADAVLADFPPVEIIRTPLLDRKSPRWLGRMAWQRAFARDPFLERFLQRQRVDVLTHSGILGQASAIPALCWIPDFQHRDLPEFFSAPQRWYRDMNLRLQCDHAARIILSSDDAHRALRAFRPAAVQRARVLRFVAQPELRCRPTDLETLKRRYGFDGDYLHVPNQFWAHKNHGLILKALALLKAGGRAPMVIATGPTEDYRQPRYFSQLMDHARELGVLDSFRVLGVVQREDLVGLMIHAMAIINTSRYEGWSTSVEEAKSLGKRVVLSDLPVHREQAPTEALYVDPDDPAELADAIRLVLRTHDPTADDARMARARRDLPERVRAFGHRFEEIILEASSATAACEP